MHKRRYAAGDPGGARRVSGRYSRGLDLFPEEEAFGALYLALSAETCIGEVLRHVTPEMLPLLNDYRLTELSISLEKVVDCRDPRCLDLSDEDLLQELDYSLTHEISAAAYDKGFEGMLVPSATRLGDNLVLFTDNLGDGSKVEALSSRDPLLYVNRP